VRREPEGSTSRYASWANGISEEELSLHRFRECTLLMPTWFMHRHTFDAAGGFREEKARRRALFITTAGTRISQLGEVDLASRRGELL
jgi:hypothetical protein